MEFLDISDKRFLATGRMETWDVSDKRGRIIVWEYDENNGFHRFTNDKGKTIKCPKRYHEHILNDILECGLECGFSKEEMNEKISKIKFPSE